MEDGKLTIQFQRSKSETMIDYNDTKPYDSTRKQYKRNSSQRRIRSKLVSDRKPRMIEFTDKKLSKGLDNGVYERNSLPNLYDKSSYRSIKSSLSMNLEKIKSEMDQPVFKPIPSPPQIKDLALYDMSIVEESGEKKKRPSINELSMLTLSSGLSISELVKEPLPAIFDDKEFTIVEGMIVLNETTAVKKKNKGNDFTLVGGLLVLNDGMNLKNEIPSNIRGITPHKSSNYLRNVSRKHHNSKYL